MKKFSFIIFIFFPLCLIAQKVTIKHSYYTSIFDKQKHIPFVVKYTLRKDMLSCDERFPRLVAFTSDPEIPDETQLNKDYVGSGYDKGHNMSAEDNKCDETGMAECFYFSNIYPQTPKLNRGVWKQLEVKERLEAKTYDSVKVFIGSYGSQGTIGADNIEVPAFCWKVIYAHGEYQAYVFPNVATVQGPVSSFKTTIEDIERRSGYHFRKTHIW